MESVSKFKTYLNSILNTIDDDVHNELWNHLSNISLECCEVYSKLQKAIEERDKAKWSAEERLQAFYGIQEHSNDMWFLLKEISEVETISDSLKGKIKKIMYPEIKNLPERPTKEDDTK